MIGAAMLPGRLRSGTDTCAAFLLAWCRVMIGAATLPRLRLRSSTDICAAFILVWCRLVIGAATLPGRLRSSTDYMCCFYPGLVQGDDWAGDASWKAS